MEAEANDFVQKLKADGSANDVVDLKQVSTNYKEFLSRLPPEVKEALSLNVLCMMCRNIEKVPSWRDKIDVRSLLNLSLTCLRQTTGLVERPERQLVLASVYHLHKFIVRQPSPLPPELILKLSFMPFAYKQDNLLAEHYEAYWCLLADRLMYMQKLKSDGRPIIKFLSKLTKDVCKVILMYDSVQFCNTKLVVLLKTLHILYNTEHAEELNATFGMIFACFFLKKDVVEEFEKLSEKETLELYVQFSDCFYVIAENAAKLNFKDSTLSTAVLTCIALIGHVPDIMHCLQTFYLDSICSLLTENNTPSIIETVLNSLKVSCVTIEKVERYEAIMKATYPYINQLLHMYIEYHLDKKNLTEDLQKTFLELIIFLLDKLKDTEQLNECDNCTIKSGLHDALRLSLLGQNVVSHSLNSKLDVTVILQPYLTIINKQHSIVTELCRIGCANHEKSLRNLQTNIENTAILLNNAGNSYSAIQLFDIYFTHEHHHFKTTLDLMNISRALYNKSICELEYKSYKEALLDGLLSLALAQPDKLTMDKNMSLVIDVKAKASQNGCDDEDLQMMTVLEACDIAVGRKLYGNMQSFFCNLELGPLLHYEFSSYARLWPSLPAVAGVWRALHWLATGERHTWMCAQPPCLSTLYSVILQTPTAVSTINHQQLSNVLSSLIDTMPATGDAKMKVTEATMLFLKAEMDLADAGVQYEWEFKSLDPDLVPCCQTLEQEHKALQPALRAVWLWTEVLPHLHEIPSDYLSSPLLVLRVMLQRLLHVRSALALLLANVALGVSANLIDREAYIEAAGIILSRAYNHSGQLKYIESTATHWAHQMVEDEKTLESALVYLCDTAIFYHNIKQADTWANFIEVVQAHVSNNSLPLAVGRLLDARALSKDLSVSDTAQQHYLKVENTEIIWCLHQRRSLELKQRLSSVSARGVRLARTLRLRRHARASSAYSLEDAAAARRAALALGALDPSRCDVARATIDQRLKRIIGVQTNECALQNPPQLESTTNQALFTPQPKLETMRDAQIPEKLPTSPSIPIEYVTAYKAPEFFNLDNYCECYACDTPAVLTLTLQLLGMEAGVYFRAKEVDLAKNCFEGVLDSFCSVENKIKAYIKKLRDRFETYIVDIFEKSFEQQLFNVELEVLIEAAYFELSQKNCAKSDVYIYERIPEIMQAADIDAYSKDEVHHLMTASQALRKADKIPDWVTETENDLENLKLTPTKEILKTPEAKPTEPPICDNVVVNKDELPELKSKIPVLNLNKPEKRNGPKKTTNSKIPIPVRNKPVLKNVISKPTSTKVKALVRQTSNKEIDATTSKEFKENITTKPEGAKENILKRISKTTKVAKSDLKKNAKPNIPKPKTKIDSKSALNPKRRVDTLKGQRPEPSTSLGKLPKEENSKTRLGLPSSRVDRDDKK